MNRGLAGSALVAAALWCPCLPDLQQHQALQTKIHEESSQKHGVNHQ